MHSILRPLRSVALAFGMLAASSFASAAITIADTDPSWSNAVGGSNIDYNDANWGYTDVRWGISAGSGQSGLGFNPANPPASTYAVNEVFSLGNLRHYNNPVFNPASSVDLTLLTRISGAVPAWQDFRFRFLIDETTNAYPCLYPSTTPCADRITFQNLDLTSAFSISGQSYTIELLGFSTNGGATITSFFDSQEGRTNTAGLFGRITSSRTVPEPATLALVAVALLAAGGASRLKQRARR